MPGLPRAAVTAARLWLRRYARDLRASRAFLASEVSHGGWLDAGQFRWRDATPGRAARAAFGVAVPLALGLATRHVEYGTFAALGAQPAGVVSFQGVTRSRIMLVTIAVAGMAVSTFVGATVASAVPWLMPVVVALWAYAAGVCAALGPTALIVALQWPVAVLIASAVPLGPEQALVRSGLVVAGGLWQAVLVISTWAISRGAAERTAMAASYAALGRYASRLGTDRSMPPPPEALPGTRALRDPNPLMRSDARRHLTDLMVEAERIRTTLAVAAGRRSGGGAPGADRAALLAAVAGALDEVAAALRARPADRAGHLAAARAMLGPDPGVAGHAWTWAGESLHGQVRGAIRMAQRLNDTEPGRGGRPPSPVVRPPAHDLVVTLRANLTTSSEAGRHALRLAVVTGLTAVLARALGLPHAYWAVLTALLVLRPDYGSTLYRGVQRAGGTVLGAGVGVAIVLAGRLRLGRPGRRGDPDHVRRVRAADRQLPVLLGVPDRVRRHRAGPARPARRPDRAGPADRDRPGHRPGPAGLRRVADLGAHHGQREIRPAVPNPGPVRQPAAARLHPAGRARTWPAPGPPSWPPGGLAAGPRRRPTASPTSPSARRSPTISPRRWSPPGTGWPWPRWPWRRRPGPSTPPCTATRCRPRRPRWPRRRPAEHRGTRHRTTSRLS